MDPNDKKDLNTGTSYQTSTGTAATRARVLDNTSTPVVGEQKATNVVSKVSEVASDIANKASDLASKVSENIDYKKIRQTAVNTYDKTVDYSKRKPITALGISLGVGVLFGYLIAPKRPNYYRSVNCIVKDVTNILFDRLL